MITYTTDFTEPDENSNIYTGPITIDETTIVRAKAFKENYISLHSNSRNYFFNTDSEHPIIHLVTDEYNLFDYNYGIYAYGPEDYGGYPFLEQIFGKTGKDLCISLIMLRIHLNSALMQE